MKFTYYGHSCFSVFASGKTLLFDPFVTPNKLASGVDVDAIEADFIFVSHGHCGFAFRTTDGTFYYSGDTGLTFDMKLVSEWTAIDFAVFPIGDGLTMYGGSVITDAAYRHPNVKALVYIDGTAPDVGESAASLAYHLKPEPFQCKSFQAMSPLHPR